jgi:XTP/dITP diphosphohydrolase
MLRLLLATRNAHKTREFAEILGKEFKVCDFSGAPDAWEIEETGTTFEENAVLKALASSQDRHLFVVADDSGLEVDALDGAPGIYSARYSGQDATDAQNVDKLLGVLARRNVPTTKLTARFRCVIALAREGKLLNTFEGAVEGVIIDRPRGEHGFGYDPIFVPKGFDQTFAELPAETKNEISHRAQAARKLAHHLNTLRTLR